MKKCPRCKEVKKEQDFNRNKSKKDGLSSTCKECNKYHLREHYLNNKDYYKERNRKRRKECIDWIKKIKTEKGCQICGENFGPCLHFHHLDSNSKDIEIAIMYRKDWSKSKMTEEISKCIILCCNCHMKLHWGVS